MIIRNDQNALISRFLRVSKIGTRLAVYHWGDAASIKMAAIEITNFDRG